MAFMIFFCTIYIYFHPSKNIPHPLLRSGLKKAGRVGNGRGWHYEKGYSIAGEGHLSKNTHKYPFRYYEENSLKQQQFHQVFFRRAVYLFQFLLSE